MIFPFYIHKQRLQVYSYVNPSLPGTSGVWGLSSAAGACGVFTRTALGDLLRGDFRPLPEGMGGGGWAGGVGMMLGV